MTETHGITWITGVARSDKWQTHRLSIVQMTGLSTWFLKRTDVWFIVREVLKAIVHNNTTGPKLNTLAVVSLGRNIVYYVSVPICERCFRYSIHKIYSCFRQIHYISLKRSEGKKVFPLIRTCFTDLVSFIQDTSCHPFDIGSHFVFFSSRSRRAVREKRPGSEFGLSPPSLPSWHER